MVHPKFHVSWIKLVTKSDLSPPADDPSPARVIDAQQPTPSGGCQTSTAMARVDSTWSTGRGMERGDKMWIPPPADPSLVGRLEAPDKEGGC